MRAIHGEELRRLLPDPRIRRTGGLPHRRGLHHLGQSAWRESTALGRASQGPACVRPEGVRNLRIAYLERVETRRDKQGREIQVRRIVRVHKRLMVESAEEGGHTPILRAWVAYEVGSSWSTNLTLPAPEIARLYEDHGTSEQFHSELKGELDLERLPSGKFKTNELMFQLGCLAFNLLRLLAIKGKAVFRHRNPSTIRAANRAVPEGQRGRRPEGLARAKRRRIKCPESGSPEPHEEARWEKNWVSCYEAHGFRTKTRRKENSFSKYSKRFG